MRLCLLCHDKGLSAEKHLSLTPLTPKVERIRNLNKTNNQINKKMNVHSEIQRFNADPRIGYLHSMYESNSFMNCLSVSRREMSHSRFLSELLKEESFHDAGTLPLQLFLEAVLDRAIKQGTRLKEHPEKAVMFPSLKSAILARSLSLRY